MENNNVENKELQTNTEVSKVVETPEVLETTEVTEVTKKENPVKVFFAKNEIARLTAVLLTICAVTSLMLAVVNGITAPIIKEKENGAVITIMETYLPNGENLENYDVSSVGTTVTAHTRVSDNSEKFVGDVVTVAVKGYGSSPLQIVVVLDEQGAIVATQQIASEETNGIGTKAFEPEFTSLFEGKATTDGIDTISGATITSTAYIGGVQDALDYVSGLK